MTMDREAWEPATADDLKVGDYIRIDHRWFDHPFERRMFRITSDQEIATIREQALTRVFVERTPIVDTASPGVAAPAPPAAPVVAEPSPPVEAAAVATAAEGEGSTPEVGAALPVAEAPTDAEVDAARQAAQRAEQRMALEAARTRDKNVRERAEQALGMLSAGHQDSAAAVSGLVDFLLAILNNSTTPIAPMAPTTNRHSKVRLALLGSDAVWMAALIGKRMGLTKPELRALTHAAAVHAVGLTRMPPNLPEEEPGTMQKGTPLANYPAYSVMILQQCGSFPKEVLRIVGQHRERPDGTGLPQGLKGDQIHPHALIIGAVRELQICCAGNAVAPAVALARIYKRLRDTYGTAIVNHLASAVLYIPVGTYVQLSDGAVARVTAINESARLVPVVEWFGPNGQQAVPDIVDLTKRPDLFIVRALDTSRLPPRLFDTWRNTGPDTRPPQPEQELPTVAGETAAAETEDPALAGLQASGA